MRTLIALILTVGFCVAAWMGVAQRQTPDPEQVLEVSDGDDLDVQLAQAQGPGRAQGGQSSDGEDLVVRMMAFDTDKDGKLTKVEITDARLHRLFDRSDANKDGIVTKDELASLATKEHSDESTGGPGFGGPPGFGPPGGGPPGGGPPGGFMMGMGRPGEILSRMLQDRLKFTPQQRTELEDLQKEVDAKLDKILSAEQKTQLKQLRERGPGGFGPRGGGPPGGRGFGGPPPPPGGRGFGPPPGGGGPPPPPDEV
jgi:EF hand